MVLTIWGGWSPLASVHFEALKHFDGKEKEIPHLFIPPHIFKAAPGAGLVNCSVFILQIIYVLIVGAFL